MVDMIKDSYPFPCIETNLNKLAGAKIFSSLDSAKAFHSLTISPTSRDYTTFVPPLASTGSLECPLAYLTPLVLTVG